MNIKPICNKINYNNTRKLISKGIDNNWVKKRFEEAENAELDFFKYLESIRMGFGSLKRLLGIGYKKICGVKVKFGNNEELNRLVTTTLKKLHRRHLPLPPIIILDDRKAFILSGLKSFKKMLAEKLVNSESVQKKCLSDILESKLFRPLGFCFSSGKGKPIIFINPDIDFKTSTGKGFSSTLSKKHVLMHEIGHAMHFLRDRLFYSIIASGKQFSILEKEMIVSEVSKSASKDIREFVAEVYAGLVQGKKYSKKIMDLYKKSFGPVVK